jgi:outer membrane immunogenic protein
VVSEENAAGVAYGAGIEMRLWAGITGKLEYLHMDFPGVTNSFALVPAPFYLPGNSLTTTHGHKTDEVFRAGLNWKFSSWSGSGGAAY